MPHSPAAPQRARLLSGSLGTDLAVAAKLLRLGGLVAFPTETVFGLGADACNPSAVAAIFSAKGRPSDNPLIVHVASTADISRLNLTPPLSPIATALASAFWPGPLTLVLPLAQDAGLSPAVSAGLSSVAVRVPQHPIAAELLGLAGIPVAAPSANLSGRPSPTCAEHVMRDLSGAIDAVVDDTSTMMDNCGLESTVVDLTGTPTLLRPGAISLRQLEQAAGVEFRPMATLASADLSKPKAPGMKYRHYAPRAPLYLVVDDVDKVVGQYREKGKLVGILATDDVCARFSECPGLSRVVCGKQNDTKSFARELYAALRAFDGEGSQAVMHSVDIILAVPPNIVDDGIGEAVMNRLRKAAAGRHETVDAES